MRGRRSRARLGASALLILALAAPIEAGAQTPAAQSAPPQGVPIPLTLAAKPENAFSRFEIVSLGSFPIMLFYTGFFFDLGLYIANFPDPIYLPWPMKNEKSYSATLPDSERITRIGIALSASLVVGAIDAYLHAAKARKSKRLSDASRALAEP